MVAALHPLVLRPPLLIERTDQNFIQGLYEDLKTSEGRSRLRDQASNAKAQGLRLKQPVHRAHNVLLMDVACDGLGYPRLDPRKLASAGIVVRRMQTTEKGLPAVPEVLEGWMTQDKTIRGWSTFSIASDLDGDPDPKLRKGPYASGHVEINRRLMILASRHFELSEATTPAFAVPPEVCEAAGRTLVFGVIPVTSFEITESAPVPQFSDEEMRAGYPTLLMEGPSKSISAAAMNTFIRQVAAEFGAFGDEPEERAFYSALNAVTMPTGQGAADFLKSAYARIFETDPPGEVSAQWPAISKARAQILEKAVFAVKQKRLSRLMPQQGRFEDRGAWYKARMFLRVRNHPECAPQLYWSDYTDPFQIAPWYEPYGPPVKIQLPDITRANVKNMRPNVSFELPPGLFNILANNSPDDFLKGKAKEGGAGIGIAWLCSFSLPIITLCAFIVLNIFLQLLNIVFWWLLWIKICIPIPVPKKN